MDYDKICEHCGQKYDTLAEMQAHTSGPECLRRQLAAANERAGRLEAEKEELRAAWSGHGEKDIGMTDVRIWLWTADYETLTRILGGA